ncbi:UbiA family prenyltransferase [Amycolatopsis sp. cg5]|uniref:UbiA family prenyltransferase n=1 Tax=Amycolatopsis sp. cg5 TaxID=3238802 RepID=UPI00352594E3
MTTSWRRHLIAHLQTWRPYTLCYPGLVGLAGLTSVAGAPSLPQLVTSWAIPTLGWLSGHYLGDYFDRHLDAISKPHRPIPSGRLSPRAAVTTGAVFAASAAIFAALTNWHSVVLLLAAMAGIVAYSYVFKGRGLSGNIVRGTLTGLALLFGVMQTEPLPPWRILPFAAMFLLHDTASNLVGTLRDVEGDRAGGYRTFPVRHDIRVASRMAVLLYIAALTAAAAGAWASPGHLPAFWLLLLLAAVVGVRAFVFVLGKHSQFDALRAHQVLVAERLILAGAVVANGLGLIPALIAIAVVLAISLPTQAVMRARHEFPSLASSVMEERRS